MNLKLTNRLTALLAVSLLCSTFANTQNVNAKQQKSKVGVSKNADYVFTNGAIYTINSKEPYVESIAIKGKLICYVGSNLGVQSYIGENTKVTDLQGKMLLPGFIEAHIHPTLAIFTKGANLQYDDINELLTNLKKWSDKNPQAKVIQGFGWRYNLFPKTGPSKALLDKLFPDKPVMLIAIDVHSAWVNSKALELAGINSKFPDPAPGLSYFQRDPKTNEPTGWVVETIAEQLILAKLDPPTPDKVNESTAEKLNEFATSGITSLFDAGIGVMPTELGFAGYRKLEKENKLPIRIVGSYYWNNPSVKKPVDKIKLLHKTFNTELLQLNTLKILADGGDFQHTSAMLKPYADKPESKGEFQIDPKLIKAAVIKAQASGFNTHAHVVGDRAVRVYLDAVEEAKKIYPNSASRHTAAHAQYMTDTEVERLAKLNVTCQSSVQWNIPDPGVEMSINIVGKDIMDVEYGRVNSVLKAGGRVAFGTDWPAANYVSTFHPLDAIQAALTRAILTQYSKKEFAPVLEPSNEKISLDQALKAYTIDAAYILGLENKIGSLEVGKAADLVVLEKDLHKIAINEISTTKVLMTMMNGKITFVNTLK